MDVCVYYVEGICIGCFVEILGYQVGEILSRIGKILDSSKNWRKNDKK